MVSTEQMQTILPKMNWAISQSYLPQIKSLMPSFGIDTPLRKSHFLAQVAHESGGFYFVKEGLNYSGDALWSMFRKYFSSREEAQQYHRQPVKIANRVYANRMGNGDEASGEGWKYRGRGLIQLTGKENYQKFANDNGIDCVNNPDLLLDPKWAFASACWYWKNNNINKYADLDDIEMVTKKINGGFNGLEDRRRYLESFKRIYEAI